MSDKEKEIPQTSDTVKIRITDGNGWIYDGVRHLEGAVVTVPKSVHDSMTEGKVKTEVLK